MDNENKCAIKIQAVSKRFRQGTDSIHALKGVTLNAYFNELLMIVGPSGCGKTTLLSVLAGTLRSDSGEVHVLENPLHHLKDSLITPFRRKNIGFIFQEYHLIKTISCLENVSVPLLLNGEKKAHAEARAAEMLAQVGLKGREREKPSNLSGGQKQRVAIARALVHQPKLVICDEPTAALDAESGLRVMELMVKISKESSRCVIVVTHDNRIFKYADRTVVMNDGRIESMYKNSSDSIGMRHDNFSKS